jgi:hypothetical protein
MNEITAATKKMTASDPSHHYRDIEQSNLGCGTK